MHRFAEKIFTSLVNLQKRFYIPILLLGMALTVLAAPNGIKLLTTIRTDLIHLLPADYPSVHYSDEIKKKFNRRSSLFVILESPDPAANKKALFAVRDHLLGLSSIESVIIEKIGYDFIDRYKLLLIELEDLYNIRDRIKEKIQKRKLGGLYIDFEDEETGKEKKDDVTFDDFIKRYKDEYASGVQNRYRTNEDETVFVLDVYPSGGDEGISYFKKFGTEVDEHLKKMDLKTFHPALKYGYAGAIKTRVDQYEALMHDLKIAGMISLCSIFCALYLYFLRMLFKEKVFGSVLTTLLVGLVPVILVFIPMIMSTLIAFSFCFIFFKQLNLVTSFLFSIIFGLGVDIGIHMATRYIQDVRRCGSAEQAHRNVITRTGKSCTTAVITTVASFYILTLNDFKGFSEFGWIAGNGLIIALLCYLFFFPCLLLLVDRFNLLLLHKQRVVSEIKHLSPERIRGFPIPKLLLTLCLALVIASLFGLSNLEFEWDFSKLKMKLEHREYQKSLVKQTSGRVNSPASYLVENEAQARKMRQVLRDRQKNDNNFKTIQFFRSYYDLVPFDQDEKLAILADINTMLRDDALNTLNADEKKLLDEFTKAIAETKRITPSDIPSDIKEVFWGNTGEQTTSVAGTMPLPQLELDNGYNARAFYDDVHEVTALGKKFYAVSDSIVFAEVLQTLFKGAKAAIFLTSLMMLVLIGLHYRDVKRSALVLFALATGVFWMLGIMAVTDMRLNFYNMIVIPAMIGMGEDNSVQIMDRFEEMGRKSIMDVLRTSGGAALMASITAIIGYGGMCFTRHPGLQSIGWMAIVGLGACMVTSLFFLPVMMQLFLKPAPFCNHNKSR
ncbi:MAG: MMPL family transporter [Deltaproteobacteria bacterium]|nr:MMPL family transporter [Deltaproteobacteria bacterium]